MNWGKCFDRRYNFTFLFNFVRSVIGGFSGYSTREQEKKGKQTFNQFTKIFFENLEKFIKPKVIIYNITSLFFVLIC